MANLTEKQILLNSYTDFAHLQVKSLNGMGGVVIYEVNETQDNGILTLLLGEVSNRHIGDKMTVFLIEVLQNFIKTNTSKIILSDYEPSTAVGRVRLDIFAIRTSDNKIVGLLVSSLRTDILYDLKAYVDRCIPVSSNDKEIEEENNSVEVNEKISITDHVIQLIDQEIKAYPIAVERMTTEEKKEIIIALEQLEVFFVKDAVKTAANLLEISIPTLYRLLKQ